MKYTEALNRVLEAAGIRRDQWDHCANEGSPENCIDELWESGHDESQNAAADLTGAIRIVRELMPTHKSEPERINAVIKQLAELDCTLAEIVMDYQDAAEDAGNTSSGFGDICVPEDANEDVDGVRVHIDEAMTQLQKYLDALNVKQVEQHKTEEQRRKDEEKNITKTFGNNGQWHAELNIEYDGDDLVSWCHVSTTRNGQDYCSSIGVVEAFGTVEGETGDDLKVPTAIFDAIHKWALEEGY